MRSGMNGMRALHGLVNTIILICGAGLLTGMVAGCIQSLVQEREYETPAGFLLGPEDVLDITVWKNPDLSRVTAIRPDGLISISSSSCRAMSLPSLPPPPEPC